MTRKDYVLLAEELCIVRAHIQARYDEDFDLDTHGARLRVWDEIVSRLSDTLHEENPLFDRKRFYAAVTDYAKYL